MTSRFVVTGTDTDVGKTVFSAALAGALNARYWKPVQAGLDTETDVQTVAALSGLPRDAILSEAYRLNTPCSPHRAAEIDGVEIRAERLALPDVDGALVIEGAGGVAVPLYDDYLFVDQFAAWDLPVILVARTELGTISHSLLSIEALKLRGIVIHGVAFVGAPHQDSEAAIARISGVRRLGRLPILDELSAPNLQKAFHDNFSIEDFR